MSDHRQLKKQVSALLAGLGRDADEVAESLEEAGVKGVPKSNRTCAIALYLNAAIGADPRIRSVAVGHCSLLVDLAAPPDFRHAGRLAVQLPKPVRRFVTAFDAQHYPKITRRTTEAPRTAVSPAG